MTIRSTVLLGFAAFFIGWPFGLHLGWFFQVIMIAACLIIMGTTPFKGLELEMINYIAIFLLFCIGLIIGNSVYIFNNSMILNISEFIDILKLIFLASD